MGRKLLIDHTSAREHVTKEGVKTGILIRNARYVFTQKEYLMKGCKERTRNVARSTSVKD